MTEFNKFRWHEVAVKQTKNTAARVVGVMFDRADMDGSRVYINNKKLAAAFGCDEKSIRRARKQIEALGLAVLIRKGHNIINGPTASSEYRLAMPASQVDISHATPQVDISTSGHSSPHNRTSASAQPDSSAHLIDPLPDPGNKPGSVLESEADIGLSGSEDPTGHEVSGDASHPVDEEQTPEASSGAASDTSTAGSRRAVWDGYSSEESDPQGSPSTGAPAGAHQPDTGVSGINRTLQMSGVVTEPSTESEAMKNDPFDPWAEDAAKRAAESAKAFVPRVFKMPQADFVGVDTDPATGGPDWSQQSS